MLDHSSALVEKGANNKCDILLSLNALAYSCLTRVVKVNNTPSEPLPNFFTGANVYRKLHNFQFLYAYAKLKLKLFNQFIVQYLKQKLPLFQN